MNIYSRARKHIDMNRVKELKEEKDIADLKKQHEIALAEISRLYKEKNKHYDWRTGKNLIKEGMTTASLGMINYPAEGDNNLENVTQTATPGTDNSGGSDGTYSFGNYDGTGNGGFVLYLDTTKYDTLKFSASNGNATRIEVSVGGGGYQTLSNGTNRITISSANRGQNVVFLFNASKSGGSGATGASISGVTFQRRNPINVFVGLDDPEANSFIRDGQADNLSPKEKKKKLEEQLRSSKEYLNKMFGEGMPGTATQIADYNPQQSFMDIRADGERITKIDGETIRDTTRDIEPQPTPKPTPTSTPQPTPTPTPTSTTQPTPPESSIPSLYQNRSAAWLSGAIGNASIERLTDNFRGTTVSVPRLVSLTKQIDRLDDMISRNARSSNVEQIQSLIDRRNNYQERLKAEIEGSKPDLKPITQVPSSSDNQAELEKNIEASLKQLGIDNKQLKGDALKRNIELAKDLGLDILTAVAMLTPIPGDEAAALSAQAAKAGVKVNVKTATRPFQNASDDVIRAINRSEVYLRANKAIRNAPKGFKNDVAIEVNVGGVTKRVGAADILRFKGFQVNSYEPLGKLLTESKKKSFHDFIDKMSEKNLVKEGMTTAGLGMINLNATGNVDLVDLGNETPHPLVQPGATNNNGTYTFGPVADGYGFASTLTFTQRIDLTKVDTLVFDFTAGDITSFDFVVNSSSYNLSTSSGRKVITLKQSDRVKNALLSWVVDKNRGEPVGINRISGVALQRRKPINLFVPLDDPEANSFIRDGVSGNLSSEEKKKKLEHQLQSSSKYLTKIFGEGMPNTATTIADYEPQQSFADIAAAQQGPIPPGPRGYKKPGTYNPDKFYQYRPEKPASPNLPFTGPGYSKGIDGTEVAASYPTTNTPLDKVGGFKGIPKGKGIYPMDKDGNLYNPQTGLPIKKAGKRQKTMVAHHEPQGETIMEKNKKSFNDFTKKIPGYYDGKPSPLGFPIVEPPKMKDGMHPDLVDGKKTAKRFNRLDPISAKAMPKTGNPHIDKKVKAAAKKPK